MIQFKTHKNAVHVTYEQPKSYIETTNFKWKYQNNLLMITLSMKYY